MSHFDTTKPDWYLDIPEDFDFSLVFKFELYDEFGTMWSCDEEVDMSDPNDCAPCTSYAMWVEPGDGQFKQDNDGKCWSTNEQGTSNGLRLCNEVLTEQLEGEMCKPCTSYAMWVEPGDGQYKQDYDGKCWSTNEAGTSNGLHLCWEFSGFTEDQAPWNKSQTVSCWHHDESAQ